MTPSKRSHTVALSFYMRRWERFILLLIIACVSFPHRSPAPITYRPDEGITVGEEEPVELKKNATDQYNVAAGYEAQGNPKRALSGYRTVVRRYPKSEMAAKAQFKVGQLTDQLGDPNRAFKEYQILIDKYPKSTDFEAAVGAQFEIARQYLDGKRLELFGVPTFPSMSRAEEMFVTVIRNAPYLPKYAAAAQFNIGQAREKQGELARAIEAYQKIIDDYPFSDMADDAQYQIGYAYMQASRSGDYDQSASIKAQEAFEDFVYRYPTSEKLAQAKENMAKLGGRQTESSFKVAAFYDKQKNYKAAAIYYNEVIRTEPDSADGQIAKKRLDELKTLVGEDKLTFAPPAAQDSSAARLQQRMQAQINSTARPDYVGPPAPEETPKVGPPMRTSPDDVAPLPPVEPALPSE